MRKPIEYTPGFGINLSDIEVRSPEQEYLDKEYASLTERYLVTAWSVMKDETYNAGYYEDMERAVIVSPDALAPLPEDVQRLLVNILESLAMRLPHHAGSLFKKLDEEVVRPVRFDEFVYTGQFPEYRLAQELIYQRLCAVLINSRSRSPDAAHTFYAKEIKIELAYGLGMLQAPLPEVLNRQLTDLERHSLAKRIAVDTTSTERYFGEHGYWRNIYVNKKREVEAGGTDSRLAERIARVAAEKGSEALRGAVAQRRDNLIEHTTQLLAVFPQQEELVARYIVRPDGYVPKVE